MNFAAMSYLGSVTSNTRTKCDEVLNALRSSTEKELTHVWGKAVSGEHATGRALDFMVFRDRAAGEWIASYLTRNANRLGVAWVIWQQAFWSVNPGKYGPARQWNPMENRGNDTQNHKDHVHVLFASDSYTATDSSTPPPPPPAPPAQVAPPFPLPAGWYFGPRSGPRESVSGYYGHRESLRVWQTQMRRRGWTLDADGLYGPVTAKVARAFQAEKGLGVDEFIGAETWRAAWEAAVTA